MGTPLARPWQAPRATVLVVDDDSQIRALLRLYLEREGHRVLEAGDGEAALELAASESIDLALVDVMLPGVDGFEICRRIRDSSDTPIMLLTARSGDSDKVIGLDLGADDYVVKPFSPRELMARVRAQLRRRHMPAPPSPVYEADGLVVDPNTMQATLEGQPIALTASEFRLLYTLMGRPGRVFTRDELIEATHGYDDPGIIDRTIDVHLGRLRGKLGDRAGEPRFIGTVRSIGYRFVAPVTPRDPEESA
ncbi:MAG TPA: response regulator transcription factor [Candidatus Limnocylindrales bacterium]|jgi:DNA-binding response OmpR family regulator|nr:response regulator transcription factor [Candidatus Limnocylindrales bacterium]